MTLSARASYEENPLFASLAKAYAKSSLKDQLTFFEYCQLHLKADEISVIDALIYVLEGSNPNIADSKET